MNQENSGVEMKKFIVGFVAILLAGIVGAAGGLYMFNQDLSTVKDETVYVSSGGKSYPAYMEEPHVQSVGNLFPAVVLIHSFNGLEQGYKTLMENLASEGYASIAPEWQTYTQTPTDEEVKQLISDSVAYLVEQHTDVDPTNIGLVGFCAGGRYTMLFLPQMTEFKSGVAFYGFPYSGGFNNESLPVNFVSQLNDPLLIIHGTGDQASNITDIYRYAQTLDSAGEYFEMKIYQGEPHGFMIVNGTLSQAFAAKDAYTQMKTFFDRTLK
jgi:carboxymethylenebutenolidase